MSANTRGLVRGIGRWDLVAILINVVIGAGILGLPAKTFALIGSWSLLAWLLCALIMGVVAACFAEVGSRFAQTGGPYLYAHVAFGPVTGFLVGWLTWVSRLFSFATITNLAVTYAAGLVPALEAGLPRLACIVVVTLGLTALVLTGLRRSAQINNGLTVCKLLVLVGFVVLCLPFVEPARLAPGPAAPIGDWQAALLMMSFAFIGSESAMVNAGEMRNPTRDIPFALALALTVIALLYIAIQIVCIGTVLDLATTPRPVVEAARLSLGPLGANLINVGALVTMLGTLFAILLTGSRLPFAFAEQGQWPRAFAAVHPRFQTPHVAILVTGILAGLLTVYSSFMGALVVTALTRLVGYATTCAALLVLRARETPGAGAGFRVPAGAFVAGVGIVACIWLTLGSSRAEFASVLVIAASGIGLWAAYVLLRRHRV